MPLKSKAQAEKFKQLLADGKISQKVYDEFVAATGKRELPERVGQRESRRSSNKIRSIGKAKVIK